MKTEVACTSCGYAYLVDRSLLDDTGAVPCPGCGQSMLRVLGQPPQEGKESSPPEFPTEEPSRPEATTGNAPDHEAPEARRFLIRPSGAAAAQATAPAVESVRSPEPAHDDTEVVCPRCSLHFQPRARQARVPAAGRKTVLVVEDNPYFIEIARDALSELFEVRTARSFDEAWSVLAAGGVELLVLDLMLGGGEEGRALLEQLGVKPCPILVFTARDESEMYGEEWEQLQRLGADDMVLKGMNVGETLVRKACELLEVPVDADGLT